VRTQGLDLTIKGQALAAKIEAGKGNIPLEITRFVTASGHSDDPWALEDVMQIQQTATITSQEEIGARANIAILITNWGNPTTGELPLEVGYPLSQIGCYAIDPDEGEILYRILQLEKPNYIPAANEMPLTLNPTFNISIGNASEVNIRVDPAGIATIEQLEKHIKKTPTAPDGVHGFRWNDDLSRLQFKNPHTGDYEDLGTGAELANSFVIDIEITKDDYFVSWMLYENLGGINAPLEIWGFTNSTLNELPSKVSVDINTNTMSIYTTSKFADRIWSIEQYQDNVYILTAADVSLILVRR